MNAVSNYCGLKIFRPLPGMMLDGFLSTFLLLSSFPFLGTSVRMYSWCKKTKIDQNLFYGHFMAISARLNLKAYKLERILFYIVLRKGSGHSSTDIKYFLLPGYIIPLSSCWHAADILQLRESFAG